MKKNLFVKAAAVLTMLMLALVITSVPGTALATASSVAITAGAGQSYTMPVGGTVDLTASMVQTGTSGTPSYTWGLSNANVSLTASSGDTTQVLGLNPGTTVVTLTGVDDADSSSKTASITITVTAMTISKTSLALVGGASSTLTVGNVLSGSVVWSSNNLNVATVDASSGYVSAVGAGSATITATSDTGSGTVQTKTCAVTVTPVITLTPASQNITSASTTGTTLALTVQYGGDLISSASTVAWSNSNTGVGALVADTTFATSGSSLVAYGYFTSSATAVNGTATIKATISGTGTYTTSQSATVTVKTSQYLEIVGESDITKSTRTQTYTVYLKNADGTVVDNDSGTVHWSWSSSYLSLTSDDINDNRANMHNGEAHIQLYARYNTPSAGTRLYVWLNSDNGDKIYHTIYITGLSSLPQTGQDMTLVYVFGGMGAALLAAAGVWYGIHKKRTAA